MFVESPLAAADPIVRPADPARTGVQFQPETMFDHSSLGAARVSWVLVVFELFAKSMFVVDPVRVDSLTALQQLWTSVPFRVLYEPRSAADPVDEKSLEHLLGRSEFPELPGVFAEFAHSAADFLVLPTLNLAAWQFSRPAQPYLHSPAAPLHFAALPHSLPDNVDLSAHCTISTEQVVTEVMEVLVVVEVLAESLLSVEAGEVEESAALCQ